jgi:opacity protein-like surface antigen
LTLDFFSITLKKFFKMISRKFSAIAIAAVAVAISPDVKAQENNDLSKFYVTGSVGLSNPNDVESERRDYTYNSNTGSVKLLLEYDDAAEYSIGAGYFLSPETRLEFNYSRYSSDLSKLGFDGTFSGTSAELRYPASHDASVDSFILSINQDFPYSSGWKPFVGAGIGFSSVSVADTTVNLTSVGNAYDLNLGTETVLKGSDSTVFTYQLRAGVAKDVSKNADVFAEVSYTGTGGISAGSGANKIDWEGVSSIAVKGGARYRF